MTTFATLATQILRGPLQDPDQLNYSTSELIDYYNLALDFLSRELSRYRFREAQYNTTLTYAAGDYSKSLPSSFLTFDVNEHGDPRIFNVTNNSAQMIQARDYDIDTWENESASDTGTPGKFYIIGSNLLVHPRPDVSTQVKLYYYKLESISLASETVPWNSVFDKAINQFVVLKCHIRSEMGGIISTDASEFDVLRKAASDILFQRYKFRINPSQGWTNTKTGISRHRYYNPTHYG